MKIETFCVHMMEQFDRERNFLCAHHDMTFKGDGIIKIMKILSTFYSSSLFFCDARANLLKNFIKLIE